MVSPRTIVFLVLAALIVWRLYWRMRRLLVRQRLSPARAWMSACLFPALLLVLAVRAWSHPPAIAALAAGAAIGAALGVYALRLTTFEQSAAGLFYRPSAHIGVALSLVFVIRIVYRFSRLYGMNAQGGLPPATAPPALATSPITLAVFGMLAGYYVAYAIGLLRWQRRSARVEAAV